MEKLYRDIAVRVFGTEICSKVDFLRQNGINLSDLIVESINKKYFELKENKLSNKNCNNGNYCNPESDSVNH
jgi:hypothetical protein